DALLVKNLVQNHITWAAVWNGGLAAADGVMIYLPPDYRRPGNFGGVELGTKSGPRVRAGWRSAPVWALDGLSVGQMDSSRRPIDLIKIDVEGMEATVLSGAQQTIRAAQPALYVENDRPERSRAVVGMLHGLGYKVMWHL